MADLSDIRIGIDVETADVSRAVDKFEALKRKAAQLKLELNKGNITSKAYNRGIQQMAGQLGKVTGNANQAKSAMMQYRYAIESATDQQLKFATSSGKGMRRMEILAQQAGYQIGDLAVQIQSGTNAAVAFGQQGSQLLGFFGPMGALAGAGLAITTGLVAPFFKAKDTAKETEDAFRKIGEALDELESVTFDDNLRGGLLKTVKEIRGEFESSLKIVKELAAEQLKTEIKTPLKGLREQLLEYEKDKKLAYVEPDFNILGFEDPERFLQTFELLNQIQGDTREELQKSVDAAAFWLQGSGLLNQEVKKLLKGYIDIVGTVESVSKAVDTAKDNEKTGISETEKLRRKLAKERADTMEDFYKRRRKASLDAAAAEKKAEEDALKLYDDKYSKQDTINKLLFSEIKYGKDSAEYKALQNSLQDEQLKKEIELLKLSDTQKKSLVSLIDEQRRLLDQLDEEEEKRKRIADLIIPPALAAKGAGYAALSGELALRQATGLGVVEDKNGTGTKGGKRPAKSMASIIEGMKEQANLQRKLVGLSDQEADRLQILYDLKEQNKDASGKMTQAELIQSAKKIAQINAETRALEKQEQVFKDIADTISDDLTGAFKDFLKSGLKDFESFTESIKESFRDLLSDMAAKALQRKILIPLTTGLSAGLGSSAAASTMASGTGSFAGGTMGAALAAGASSLGAGASAALGLGGYSSAGLFAVSSNAAVATAAGASPMLATIGAAVPAIAAVAAVVGLLTSKTKLLDSGLEAVVKTNDVVIKSFKKTEQVRLFGLMTSGKKTTSSIVADSPLAGQILQLQAGIMSMADQLGVAADVFDKFSYRFKLSLKGLSEEDKIRRVTEELNKMGDAFASLIPNVENLNQLNQIMSERGQIEVRLLQAQGNTAALRELELLQVNEYNRALLKQVFAVEDAKKAMDDLTNSAQDFATKVEFERAKARGRYGLPIAANSSDMPNFNYNSSSSQPAREQDDNKEQLEAILQALVKIVKNTKDNKTYLRTWDITGLPPERTA